jgi:hypothetical protein
LGANSEITSHINEALAHLGEVKTHVTVAAGAAVDHLAGSNAAQTPEATDGTQGQGKAVESPEFLEAVEFVKTKFPVDDEKAREIVTENGVEAILNDKKQEAVATPPPPTEPTTEPATAALANEGTAALGDAAPASAAEGTATGQ